MTNVTIIPPGTETAEAYRASGAWGSSLISKFLAAENRYYSLRAKLAGRMNASIESSIRAIMSWHSADVSR